MQTVVGKTSTLGIANDIVGFQFLNTPTIAGESGLSNLKLRDDRSYIIYSFPIPLLALLPLFLGNFGFVTALPVWSSTINIGKTIFFS